MSVKRKGIILAGGSGSRLYPATLSISKQLLPIFDKPMIYYPLSTLMLADIREILIITTPRDSESFKLLLGDGSQWGLDISYAIQKKPEGLAQAFIIADSFINKKPSALILGDNIFYGHSIEKLLNIANKKKSGATIFAYRVKDPQRYGVVEFNKKDQVISLAEKPTNPKSSFAITGLYFYDKNVAEYAKKVKPSLRGEFEISDLNKIYLKKKKLTVKTIGRGYAWLDTGTHESMIKAHQFIQTIEHRQGLKIACLEEIAYHKKWINISQLKEISSTMSKNEYGKYLLEIIKESEKK